MRNNRGRTPFVALLAALVVAGCGGEAGDLMAIEIAKGPARGRAIDIVVKSDGRATCNDRPEETIPSDLLIDARELERDLEEFAEQGAFFEPTGPGRREYVVRTKAGTVRWSEGGRGIPRELPRTQLLALRLERLLCRGG
jgi:hypothetical protein